MGDFDYRRGVGHPAEGKAPRPQHSHRVVFFELMLSIGVDRINRAMVPNGVSAALYFEAILFTEGSKSRRIPSCFGTGSVPSNVLRDLAEIPGPLGDVGLAAVELQQQQRRFRQREFRVIVATAHLLGIEQLDARHVAPAPVPASPCSIRTCAAARLPRTAPSARHSVWRRNPLAQRARI